MQFLASNSSEDLCMNLINDGVPVLSVKSTEQKRKYLSCESCNTLFVTLEEFALHRAMSGHRAFSEIEL